MESTNQSTVSRPMRVLHSDWELTCLSRICSSTNPAWRPRRGSGWRQSWQSRGRKPGKTEIFSRPVRPGGLLYLPSCSGTKDATVHFFPEKFQIPRYSFDMVYYEKLGLYLRGKTFFKMMIYLNQRLLSRILSALPSLNSFRNTTLRTFLKYRVDLVRFRCSDSMTALDWDLIYLLISKMRKRNNTVIVLDFEYNNSSGLQEKLERLNHLMSR